MQIAKKRKGKVNVEFIATFSLGPKVPKTTPQAEEEERILRHYLMQMKIEEGQLKFPPITELPDGFDLFFQRRSLRRTYQYKLDDEQFTLTVCKDQAKEVNTDQTDVCNFDETEAKVFIYHTKTSLDKYVL